MPDFEPADGRFARLSAWLEAIGAVPVADYGPSGRDQPGRGVVTAYRVGVQTFLVHRTRKPTAGWAIFVPAADTIKVDETLAAATAALGLPPVVTADPDGTVIAVE